MLHRLKGQQGKLPLLGVLHKGSKRKQKQRKDGSTYWAIGDDLTHFRFASKQGDHLEEIFERVYGKEPDSLDIQFNKPEALSNFDCWREEYDSTGITKRCDGQYIRGVRLKDRKNPAKEKWHDYGEGYRELERPCYESMECGCNCREVGYLRFILPGFLAEGHAGEVLFAFTSEYDINEIHSNLSAFSGNSTQGLFTLRRISREVVTTDGKGQRRRREKSLCHIAPEAGWVASFYEKARYDAEAIALPESTAEEFEIPFDPTGEPLETVEAEIVTEDIPQNPLKEEMVPDVDALIAQTEAEINRLGWGPTKGRAYLQAQYNKQSRQQLTIEELQQFLDHLKSLQPAEARS